MGSAQTAGLYASMQGLADSETGNAVIHHDGARLDLARDYLSPCATFRPNTGAEAVIRIVRELHGFIIIIERHDRQRRTKRFFTHDPHIVPHINQDSWGIEIQTQSFQPCDSYQDSRT